MITEAYNYLFHCSEYRPDERKWGCYHREDATLYWTGIGPDKYTGRIALGESPEAAWAKIKIINEQTADI